VTLIATAGVADAAFLGRIEPALEALCVRRPTIAERLKFLDRRRFAKRDRVGAGAFIVQYLCSESDEFSKPGGEFATRFILETPERPASTLSCAVKLEKAAPKGRPSAYGCSALRVGSDIYVVDSYSPIFGLRGGLSGK
jgi:hypothetical protein